jgi:hypothetical protein
MTAPLDRFFAEARALLAGDIDASAFTERLGPSQSGSERLTLYPRLVTRQHRDVLDGLFSVVKGSCALVRAGLWEEIANDFLRAHPPRHWEPNRIGEPLARFLAARREADASLPVWLEELADYAWIRFAASTADLDDDDGVGFDRTLFVRRYMCDVITFAQHMDAGPGFAPAGAAPPPRSARTIVVAWSRRPGGGLLVADVSLAMLIAIGRRTTGDPLAGRAFSGLTDDLICAAERQLVAWGILE